MPGIFGRSKVGELDDTLAGFPPESRANPVDFISQSRIGTFPPVGFAKLASPNGERRVRRAPSELMLATSTAYRELCSGYSRTETCRQPADRSQPIQSGSQEDART